MGPEPLIAPQLTAASAQLNCYNDDHCAIWAQGLGASETITIAFATESATAVAVPDPSLTTTFTLTQAVPSCVLDGGYIYVISKGVTAGNVSVGVAHKRVSN